MTPVRLQRKRVKGWKITSPNGLPVVYVGRGSKWGNPLMLQGDLLYIDAGYRRTILSKWVLAHNHVATETDVINEYKKLFSHYKYTNPDFKYWQTWFRNLDLSELKGKNLMCWCGDEPCHADVLLKLANR